jgi:hypothetical protein
VCCAEHSINHNGGCTKTMTDKIQDEWRASIRRVILAKLDRVSGKALSENILYADVNLHLEPRAELPEFRSELHVLRDMGLVVIVSPGRLASERKVMITDEGRTALAEVS